jgi:hypothetical protein
VSEETARPPHAPEDDHSAHRWEHEQYIRALEVASGRIRFGLAALAVTCIVVFGAIFSESPRGWLNSRVKIAQVALDNRIWERQAVDRITTCLRREAMIRDAHMPLQAAGAARRAVWHASGFKDDCETVERSLNWATVARMSSERALSDRLKEYQRLQLDNIVVMKMPFWGISYDINDLGRLSGIAFMLLMIVLTFSVIRQHETVYLSLWRVRRLCYEYQGYNQGTSAANLLYHALAMTQVFSKPPTLARWRRSRPVNLLAKAPFWLPLLNLQQLIKHDWETRALGDLLNPDRTTRTLLWELTAFVVVLICSLVCFRYLKAEDSLWERTFFDINPWYRTLLEPTFLAWTRGSQGLRTSTPGWGVVVTPDLAHTYISDTKRKAIWVIDNASGASRIVSSRPIRCNQMSIDEHDGTVLGDSRPISDLATPEVGIWEVSATSACSPIQLSGRRGIVKDSSGNVFVEVGTFEGKRGFFLLKISPQGGELPLAEGPGRYSSEPAAEFSTVRGMTLGEEDCLYFVEGARVWRCEPGRAPTVVCGDLRRGAERRLRPRLLGIATYASHSGNHLYLADYDHRCVCLLTNSSSGCKVTERWAGGRFWSPSGLFVRGQKLYILEYRPGTALGAFLGVFLPWIRLRVASLECEAAPRVIATIGWRQWLRGRGLIRWRRGRRVSGGKVDQSAGSVRTPGRP